MALFKTQGPLGMHSRPDHVPEGEQPEAPSLLKKPFRRLREGVNGLLISRELWDAYGLADVPTRLTGLTVAQRKVLAWLRLHAGGVVGAERKWGVDRRAVAGAIAWEALENKFFWRMALNRWVGPGKPHNTDDTGYHEPSPLYRHGNMALKLLWSRLAEHLFRKIPTVAEQVETEHYLPRQTYEGRARLLATPAGAITYIAAIMRALADRIAVYGYSDIYGSPAALAYFYNTSDLDKVKKHFEEKEKREVVCRVKSCRELTLDNAMARFVRDQREYLEEAVGKPPDLTRRPPRPISGTGRQGHPDLKARKAPASP
jgi:hypothetical protein